MNENHSHNVFGRKTQTLSKAPISHFCDTSCLALQPELPGKEFSLQPSLGSWLPQSNSVLWIAERLPIGVVVWCKTSAVVYLCSHLTLSFLCDLGYPIKYVFSLEKLPRKAFIRSLEVLSHPSSPSNAR